MTYNDDPYEGFRVTLNENLANLNKNDSVEYNGPVAQQKNNTDHISHMN